MNYSTASYHLMGSPERLWGKIDVATPSLSRRFAPEGRAPRRNPYRHEQYARLEHIRDDVGAVVAPEFIFQGRRVFPEASALVRILPSASIFGENQKTCTHTMRSRHPANASGATLIRPARQMRRNKKTLKMSCRRFQDWKMRAFTSLAAMRALMFRRRGGFEQLRRHRVFLHIERIE